MTAPSLRAIGAALVSPGAALRVIAARPEPVAMALLLACMIVVAGAATLPRQLALLNQALAPTGDPVRDTHLALMQAGLLRVIVVDRVVPPPTFVLAAVLLVLAVEPVLAVAEKRRRALWALAIAGLAPLVVHRLGELAVVYLSPAPDPLRLGDAIGLPQRFATGPALLWWGDGAPPAWLLSVNARLNLFAAWSVAIWAIGLRELDTGSPTPWHAALPAGCLLVAGLVTYWLKPVVAALVLGGP
jgi:hypothetical protein